MIQLFSYEEKEIRTALIANEIGEQETWFSAQDIFHALDLTWKGARDLKKRNIPEQWIEKRSGQTFGGLQILVFINEQAVYKLAFSSQKNEKTVAFSNWVAELLKRIRTSLQSGNQNDLKRFLNISVQKDYSKQINAKNFQEGGVTKTVGYNFKNCILHTGKTPAQMKKIGKERGLKSKQTTSAKEVIRNLKPAVACSMSFTDKLVSEEGIEHEIAAKTAKDYATPLFEQLMKIGLSYEDVKKLS